MSLEIAMSQPLVQFSRLAGAPVHYARPPVAPYGTPGRPHTLSARAGFVIRLNRCFEELWEVTGRGPARAIASAGAYVAKPGMHGLGRAFDLDGLFWAGTSIVTLRDGYQGGDRARYFAVEAMLHRHFGLVLDYLYNPAHRDHFHVDDSRPVGFRPGSRAQVLFVQGALGAIMGYPLETDGACGPLTRAALARAGEALRLTRALEDPEGWRGFLLALARRGFTRA